MARILVDITIVRAEKRISTGSWRYDSYAPSPNALRYARRRNDMRCCTPHPNDIRL